MVPLEFATQAEALRNLLNAAAVVYWRTDGQGAALPLGCAPGACLTEAFRAPQTVEGDEASITLLQSPEAHRCAPLALRRWLGRELTWALRIVDGARGGLLVAWTAEQPQPQHTSVVLQGRFALAGLRAQFDMLEASLDAAALMNARQASDIATAIPQGIVLVPTADHPTGFINQAAATWLGLQPGQVATEDIASRLTALAQAALNLDSLREQIDAVVCNPPHASIPARVWYFADQPLALRVSLSPIRSSTPGGGAGWLWLLEDVSAHAAQETLVSNIMDSLDASIALIDESGQILRTNRAWHNIAQTSGAPELLRRGVGLNYLAACAQSAEQGDLLATQALAGIHAVLTGDQRVFQMEYPLEYQVHHRLEQRWFMLRVTAMFGNRQLLIISHSDISSLKAAQETTARYADLANSAATPLILIDRELRCVVNNPAHAALHQLTIETMKGAPLQEFLPADLLAEIKPRLQQALSGIPQAFRISRRFPDGIHRDFDVRHYPHRVHQDIKGVVVVMNEVTDLLLARDALLEYQNHLEHLVQQRTTELRASENQIRLILESSADGLLGMDATGNITLVNAAASAMLGYRAEELLGRNVHDAIHYRYADGSPYPAERCAVLAAVREGRLLRQDPDTFWRKNKRPLPVTVATHPIVDAGCTIGAVMSFVDITERQQAEAALRESEARFRQVADAAPVLIWMSGTDQQHHYFNKGWLNFTGRRMEEARGRAWLSGVHPDDRKRCSLTYAQAFASREPFTLEYRLWHQRGSYRWILDNGVPRHDETGIFLGFIGSGIDIETNKKAELEREKARMEAERLAQIKSEFLANMSHEIRTPLNGVLGFAQIGYRDNHGRGKSQEMFSRILDSGKLLLGIINDILDFSKIEAGKLALETVPMIPRRILEDALAVVNERASGKKLPLIAKIDPGLPGACLGDPTRLTQIVLNLLSNAIKFTANGAITLEAQRDRDWLILAVTDTGIGMTREQLERLFTPFEQADSSTTRQYGGTGLGLSISKRLAELMGGDISATSTPGQGSRFELRLPCLVAEPPAASLSPKLAASAVARQRLTGIHILAAEDNLSNQLVLENILAHENASLTLVSNGRLAVDAVARSPGTFDLVLMDLQMPEMDGLEATRCIRAMAPGMIVIGQTAHAMTNEREQCRIAGMVDSLTKPLDHEQLVATLLRHCPVPPSAQPPADPAEEALRARHRRDRILLAEDNKINQEIVLELLCEGPGLRVDIVENGQQAIDKARVIPYDLILMDIQMPVLDGLKAAVIIRQLPGHQTTPILAMTADSLPADIQSSRNAGMNDHITKPIVADKLYQTLLRWLPQKNRDQDPASPP